MSSTGYIVRRATSDDVPRLIAIWREAQLPVHILEKRFTEFQVVDAGDGRLVGAFGLKISGKNGLLHSETIPNFELVDALRPLLWERMRSVAGNHGLYRLWTQESAPFWRQYDFNAPDPEVAKRLPADFPSSDGEWLTLQLKDEAAIELSLDKEFAVFRESERDRTQRIMDQARFLKGLATLLAIVLFLFVIAASFYLMKQRQALGR
ncbi:MAG: hypothetical protein H7X97_06765 [Opitutaceae bacterium]|nr:hypothetical protein [Verrucomicrobiales bacterium]